MLIALLGKKQSGKTTAAKYIANKYDLKRVNFKDALVHELQDRFPDLLKEMVGIYDTMHYDGMNPWTVQRLIDEKPPLMRKLMQNFGTNVRRQDNPNYWVDKWIHTLNRPPETANRGIVVDDVRFFNEANAVLNWGGTIIKIERIGLESLDQHSSETEQEGISPDFTITVDTGDFAGLYRQLDEIITTNYGEAVR